MRNNFAELVSVNDTEYKNWCRKYARIYRAEHSQGRLPNEEVNYQSLIQNEYDLWERSLRTIMGSSVKEHPNRILKFNSERGIISYRELDFVAEVDQSILFCEIKLSNVSEPIKQRKKIISAWKQVRKSHNIACHSLSLLPPLVIMVDMSFVFETDYNKNNRPQEFESTKNLKYVFNNLNKYSFKELNYKNNSVKFLLLDSYDVFDEILSKEILKQDDLIRFRNIHQKIENEKLRENYNFSTDDKTYLNNPFGALQKLF